MSTLVQWLRETEAAEPPAAGQTNAPAFEVKGYQVEGNTVLPRRQVDDLLANYTGPAVEMERIYAGLADLQLTYRHLGFITVGVTLPRQRLTNGMVRVQVTEGRLSDIAILGNRYYSSNNIRRAVPGLVTNVLLNTKWLQPELGPRQCQSGPADLSEVDSRP